MNREIKFRYLWKGKWYYIDFQKDNLGIKFADFELKAKTTEWEQFTGLKDKNGKEIYEGDINKGYIGKGKQQFLGEVVFEGGAFSLKIISNDGRIDYDIGQTPELNCFDEYEVIGNIYENPKLLKDSVNECEHSKKGGKNEF